MQRLAKKRLKRKRKIHNRFKCHGNKQSCLVIHKYESKKEIKKVAPQISAETKVTKQIKKRNFIIKIIKNFYAYWRIRKNKKSS